MSTNSQLLNHINGQWQKSRTDDYLPVTNPATAQTVNQVPLSPGTEIEQATQADVEAFQEWRRTPAAERIQYLFKFKNLLEENLDAIARMITNECGKTYNESVPGYVHRR